MLLLPLLSNETRLLVETGRYSAELRRETDDGSLCADSVLEVASFDDEAARLIVETNIVLAVGSDVLLKPSENNTVEVLAV